MDRGPFGAALPANTRHDSAPCLAAVRTRPRRRPLGVEPRVFEIEVAAHAVGDVAADRAVAAELRDRRAFRVQQFTAQPLVRLRLLLDRSVRLLVESRRKTVAPEAVQPPETLGSLVAHPLLVDQLVEAG